MSEKTINNRKWGVLEGTTLVLLTIISPSVGFLTFLRGLDGLFNSVSQVSWAGAAVVTVRVVLAGFTYGKGEE